MSNEPMTSQQKVLAEGINDLKKIAENISSLDDKLRKAKNSHDEFNKRNNTFIESIQDSKNESLIKGIICIAVLVFDYMVSVRTMLYLSDILRIKVEFIAIIFSILDGFIAILASGGFARIQHQKEKMQRRYRPILVLLAIVKITLFLVYIYNSNLTVDNGEMISQLSTLEFLRILIPQVLFIVVIYLVLGIAGFGLWFIVGRVWYGVYKFLLTNPGDIEINLKKKCRYFVSVAEEYKLDYIEYAKKFNIYELLINNLK